MFVLFTSVEKCLEPILAMIFFRKIPIECIGCGPPPSNSNHQDYDANLNPSFATFLSWERATPNLYIDLFLGTWATTCFRHVPPNGWVLRVIYYRRMFEKCHLHVLAGFLRLPPAELSTRTCQGWHDFLLPESAVHAWQKKQGKLQRWAPCRLYMGL